MFTDEVDVKWSIVALASVAAVAAASLAPLPEEATAVGNLYYGVPHSDLVVHSTAYFALTLLAAKAVRSDAGSNPRRLQVVAALVFCLGLAVELLQQTVPYRSISILDVLANSVGVAYGYVLLSRWPADGELNS